MIFTLQHNVDVACEFMHEVFLCVLFHLTVHTVKIMKPEILMTKIIVIKTMRRRIDTNRSGGNSKIKIARVNFSFLYKSN